jgi:hypothetical protein
MAPISREELASLVGLVDGPRVSIYLPIHRGYPEARSNPARLRAALETAEQRLRDYARMTAPTPLSSGCANRQRVSKKAVNCGDSGVFKVRRRKLTALKRRAVV